MYIFIKKIILLLISGLPRVICILLLQGWQLPNGFSSVRNIYTNLHTKIFLLKHGKFEKKLTSEGH